MYEDIEKKLTDHKSQLMELNKIEEPEEKLQSKRVELNIFRHKETKKKDSVTIKLESKQASKIKSKLVNKSESENQEFVIKKRKKSVKIEVPVTLVTIIKKVD